MTAPRTARRRVVEAPRRRPELRALRIIVEPDLDPDLSELDSCGRIEFERGRLALVGVRAEADVYIADTMQTLSSTGMWGLESEYLDETYAQEWAELRKVLTAVGVPTNELPLEMQNEWIEWRT